MGRLPHVTQKLRTAMSAAGVALDAKVVDLQERLQQTLLLGARDVLLGELLDITRNEGMEEALLCGGSGSCRWSICSRVEKPGCIGGRRRGWPVW
jgi:hypothetical protein